MQCIHIQTRAQGIRVFLCVYVCVRPHLLMHIAMDAHHHTGKNVPPITTTGSVFGLLCLSRARSQILTSPLLFHLVVRNRCATLSLFEIISKIRTLRTLESVDEQHRNCHWPNTAGYRCYIITFVFYVFKINIS